MDNDKSILYIGISVLFLGCFFGTGYLYFRVFGKRGIPSLFGDTSSVDDLHLDGLDQMEKDLARGIKGVNQKLSNHQKKMLVPNKEMRLLRNERGNDTRGLYSSILFYLSIYFLISLSLVHRKYVNL
jgi:hypothetical protein